MAGSGTLKAMVAEAQAAQALEGRKEGQLES